MRKHLAIALLACAPALLTAGCGERGLDSQQGAVDAGEIAKRPDAFYGRSVTVVAEVEAVHGPNAFTLDEDAAFAGPDVLVFAPQGSQQAIEQDREVTVQGTVRPLVVADMDREYDWFDPANFDAQVLARFKDRPVIIADSVRPGQDGDVARRPTAPPAPGQQPPADTQYGDAPPPAGDAPPPPAAP